jgi:hypothetical protein
MGRKPEKISDFDEMRVRGKLDQNKIFIPAKKLKLPEFSSLMDYLNKTNKIFKEIATLEDVSLEIYRF